MDIGTLAIDAGIIGAIIWATQLLKHYLDPAGKLKRFYVLLPLALGVGAAFVKADPLAWRLVVDLAFRYGVGAAFVYTFGKKTVLGA